MVKSTSGKVYYVVEVLEHVVLVNTMASMMGSNYWYTNEYLETVFKYEEPFEPEPGVTVFYIDTLKMEVKTEGFFPNIRYDLGRIFPTKEKAEEFLNKIKAIV